MEDGAAWFDYTVCSSDTVCCTTPIVHTRPTNTAELMLSSQALSWCSVSVQRAGASTSQLYCQEPQDSSRATPSSQEHPHAGPKIGASLKKASARSRLCVAISALLICHQILPGLKPSTSELILVLARNTFCRVSLCDTRQQAGAVCAAAEDSAHSPQIYCSADLPKSFCRIIAFTKQMGKKNT